MKLEFSPQIFEKYSNIRFNENLSGNKYCHVTSVKPMSYIIRPSSSRYNLMQLFLESAVCELVIWF